MTKSQILYLLFLCSSMFINSNGQETPDPCPSHECNGVEIKYPFWLNDETTSEQFCGYSGFGLTCANKSLDPVLKLPKDSYAVSNINYDNFTLNLIDIDVIGVECPRVRHSFSVETLPLYQTNSDTNLTFYFNCTLPPPLPLAAPIDCLASTAKRNQSYVVEATAEFNNWYEYCDEKVDVAVKRSEIVKNDNAGITNFTGALNQGFSLDWKTLVQCGGCEESDGRCGYDNTAKEFLCFCQDNTTKKGSCAAAGMFQYLFNE